METSFEQSLLQAVGLTVDCNGDSLSEDVAISTLEGWDAAKLVQLLVVGADTLCWDSLNNLNVELIGLDHSIDCNGSRVLLYISVSDVLVSETNPCEPRRSRACRRMPSWM